MCTKAVDDYANTLEFVPDRCKTQEMCDKSASENPFMLKYCHDRYKTQELCDKVVDGFLPALKFVLDWFVTSKMIKKLYTVLYADDGLLFLMKILIISQFVVMKWVFLEQILGNINIDDTNDKEDNPDILILIRLLVWYSKFEKCKALKIELNEELMPVVWYPKKW